MVKLWFKFSVVEFESMGHDDVIKWKHFPRYWPFVREIHLPSVNPLHKGQRHGALRFSLICVAINGWVNNREAGDMRHYCIHCDVTVMMSIKKNQECDYSSIASALHKISDNHEQNQLQNKLDIFSDLNNLAVPNGRWITYDWPAVTITLLIKVSSCLASHSANLVIGNISAFPEIRMIIASIFNINIILMD